MYTPSAFVESDERKLHTFIEQNSFATLVTGGECTAKSSVPVASHLPLLLNREQGRLIGHMAKANPHWKQADGQSSLAIFHGPHAYISPGWLEAKNSVPTWNYVAVHVRGVIRLEQNRDALLEIVRGFVDFYEAAKPPAWKMETADSEFIDSLLNAIVGFTIDIEQIEGKWKLNQNHDADRREKIIHALHETGGENQKQIAELMAETLER
jgi:transcriptional regulator